MLFTKTKNSLEKLDKKLEALAEEYYTLGHSLVDEVQETEIDIINLQAEVEFKNEQSTKAFNIFNKLNKHIND